jgi:hypothetical protein
MVFYNLLDGRPSHSRPLLGPSESLRVGTLVLILISHAGARSLVGKTYWQGFFWSTALSDSNSLVRQCEGCQFFALQKHVMSHQLHTIPITWPFFTWGLDLVRSFKKAKGGFTHIFMAVDKFTKWIEVKPAASITTAKAVEFIKEIMYRFGVPKNIITDNGT